MQPLLAAAWGLQHNLALHDALYVTLARRLGASLVTGDARSVKVMRIDNDDELDWLLTLGAVVRTEDGESLRKGELH